MKHISLLIISIFFITLLLGGCSSPSREPIREIPVIHEEENYLKIENQELPDKINYPTEGAMVKTYSSLEEYEKDNNGNTQDSESNKFVVIAKKVASQSYYHSEGWNVEGPPKHTKGYTLTEIEIIKAPKHKTLQSSLQKGDRITVYERYYFEPVGEGYQFVNWYSNINPILDTDDTVLYLRKINDGLPISSELRLEIDNLYEISGIFPITAEAKTVKASNAENVLNNTVQYHGMFNNLYPEIIEKYSD